MKSWLGFDLQCRVQAIDVIDAELSFHCNIYIALSLFLSIHSSERKSNPQQK